MNVLIVKPDATSISFQADTLQEARQHAKGIFIDCFYGVRGALLPAHCPVYVTSDEDGSPFADCYSLGAFVRDTI